MRQVFISYAHKDKELANTLAEYLKDKNVHVFFDEWRIGIGERISEVLGNAIAGSNTFILLASPEALTSGWVRSELDTAIKFENDKKGRLLVIKIRDASIPPLISGKLFLQLKHKWDNSLLEKVYLATNPNIYRNGWSCRVVDFAGNGGSATFILSELGLPHYQIKLRVNKKGGYAGVFWEFNSGAVNVANYRNFTCKIQGGSSLKGRFQLKFETKDGWPVQHIPFPEQNWQELEPIALEGIGKADWERLERITIAVDDRDIELSQDYILNVADFYFY